jgi:hypothetical protein
VPSICYRYSRAWTLLVIKTSQLLSERESQSAMIICRVCARQFSDNVYKQKEMEIDTALSEIEWKYDFTFKEKQLTAIKSIDLCWQTFPKLLLLLAPKVTSNLYPECIANLKLPVDAFYRESRSGVNVAKRNITTGLFGLSKRWPRNWVFFTIMLLYNVYVPGRKISNIF